MKPDNFFLIKILWMNAICNFSEEVSEYTPPLVGRVFKGSVLFSMSKHLSSCKIRTQRPSSKDAASGRAIKIKRKMLTRVLLQLLFK